MKRLIGEEVSKWPWSDAALVGLTWQNDGRDLTFYWEQGDSKFELTCTWASSLDIHLSSEVNVGGSPLIWEYSFHNLPSDQWKADIDFGSKGKIELICNDIILTLI
jgi:hypothetical protein